MCSVEEEQGFYEALRSLPEALLQNVLACLPAWRMRSILQSSKALATEVFAVAPPQLTVRLAPDSGSRPEAIQSLLAWACQVFPDITLVASLNHVPAAKYNTWYDGELVQYHPAPYGKPSTTGWLDYQFGGPEQCPQAITDLQSDLADSCHVVYPSITRMHLQGLHLQSVLPPRLAAALPNLHTLEMSGCLFSAATGVLPVCTSVRELRLINTPTCSTSCLANDGVSTLFPNLTSLTVLSGDAHGSNALPFTVPASVTRLEVDNCTSINGADKWPHVQHLVMRAASTCCSHSDDPETVSVSLYQPYTNLGLSAGSNTLFNSLVTFSGVHIVLDDTLTRVLLSAERLQHVTVWACQLEENHSRQHCSWKTLDIGSTRVDLLQLARLPLAHIGQVMLGQGKDVILDMDLMKDDDVTGVRRVMGCFGEALASFDALSKVRPGSQMVQVKGQLTLRCAYSFNWVEKDTLHRGVRYDLVPELDWRECPSDARMASVLQFVASTFQPVHSLCMHALRLGPRVLHVVAQFTGHCLQKLHVLKCGGEGQSCIWSDVIGRMPCLRELRFDGVQGLLLKDLAGLCAADGHSAGLEVQVQHWPRRVAKLLPRLKGKVAGAKVARQPGGVSVHPGAALPRVTGHPGLLMLAMCS